MLYVSKLIFSQKGNAVLLTLGLIAVAGSVGVGVWNRKEQQKQQSRQAALKEEADMVIESFARRLQNPETCTDALAGEIVKPGENTDVVFHYETDENLANGLRLSSLQIETPTIEDMRTEIADSNGVQTALVRFSATVQAHFQAANGDAVGLSHSGIPILVWANPLDGQIISCFGRNSAGTLCNDLGGYFVPNTEPYFLSCRHSIKTERRTARGLRPFGSCRVAGIVDKAKDCNKVFGVPFAASQLQESHRLLEPEMPNQFLCELCQ